MSSITNQKIKSWDPAAAMCLWETDRGLAHFSRHISFVPRDHGNRASGSCRADGTSLVQTGATIASLVLFRCSEIDRGHRRSERPPLAARLGSETSKCIQLANRHRSLPDPTAACEADCAGLAPHWHHGTMSPYHLVIEIGTCLGCYRGNCKSIMCLLPVRVQTSIKY